MKETILNQLLNSFDSDTERPEEVGLIQLDNVELKRANKRYPDRLFGFAKLVDKNTMELDVPYLDLPVIIKLKDIKSIDIPSQKDRMYFGGNK